MQFEKFRELQIDPFAIKFKNDIVINSILNYPHAGNDVLHCLGTINKKKDEFYIKVERHPDANVFQEYSILNQLNSPEIKLPTPIELGKIENYNYLVLKKLPGQRLSFILEEYHKNKTHFCTEFGKNLATIHSISMVTKQVKIRKHHDPYINTEDEFIINTNKWLHKNKPLKVNYCFIHGDHHYANILWDKNSISATLDWELSGRGNKEFDLAWAIILRPGQKFFNTQKEEEDILNAYESLMDFNFTSYQYYKVLILSHFYSFSQNDTEYIKWIENEINRILQVG